MVAYDIQQNVNPTSGRRVCSKHFVGGKKTYENNFPTIVPKTIKPIVFKERKSRNNLELWKNNQFNLDESSDMTVENESELSVIKHEIECLKEKLHKKDVETQ